MIIIKKINNNENNVKNGHFYINIDCGNNILNFSIDYENYIINRIEIKYFSNNTNNNDNIYNNTNNNNTNNGNTNNNNSNNIYSNISNNNHNNNTIDSYNFKH